MMINGRLVGLVPESKRYVALSVGLQWVALVANVCLITAVCRLLGHVYDRAPAPRDLAVTAALALLAVAGADQIVVLDGGRVAERGTHSELMAADGLYSRLVRIQQQSLDWTL